MPCPVSANRLIGKRIRAAAVNFAPTLAYFRNAEVTGIPVRAEFFGLPPRLAGKPAPAARDGRKPGGTRAEPKNAGDCQGAAGFRSRPHHPAPGGSSPRRDDRSSVRGQRSAQDRWRVQAFLEDMPKQFAASDLILARSGASTVAELAASGKPSLLVPFPRLRTIISEKMLKYWLKVEPPRCCWNKT
jgi:UDP-N-acetylglucosamine--N-acetylmuramyl-(pentapeptide) pyrophosphoryl-undecaprenol N-acetylglucosamine transferase